MAKEGEKIRILLCKHWMDGHDRGVKYVAKKLRDWGFEVIYVLYRVPEEIISSAIAEDADAIGVSFSSAAHMIHTRIILKLMEERGLKDIALILGGIIPPQDERELLNMGVAGVFGPGSDIEKLRDLLSSRLSKAGKS